MHLLSLQLTNYRNYRTLDCRFQPGPVVLVADNAQGKSNLIEAICVTATAKSPWAGNDRELLHWKAADDELPALRAVATFSGVERSNEIEFTLSAGQEALGRRDPERPVRLRKRLRINQVPRRPTELIGVAAVVLFDPGEVAILSGEPARRRAFLDNALLQLDREYYRSSRQLAKLLPQRNALLRSIQEGTADPTQLEFWDAQLADHGAAISNARLNLLNSIGDRVRELHEQFSSTPARLELVYRSTIEKYLGEPPAGGDGLRDQFARTLAVMRRREAMQGVTLVGPQRDDFDVLLDGVNLHTFGSRGQQRTAAICLKLAEADAIAARIGTAPVLLLDEMFAELDPFRRRHMQTIVEGFEQPFITATELDHLSPSLTANAQILRIREGTIVAE